MQPAKCITNQSKGMKISWAAGVLVGGYCGGKKTIDTRGFRWRVLLYKGSLLSAQRNESRGITQ